MIDGTTNSVGAVLAGIGWVRRSGEQSYLYVTNIDSNAGFARRSRGRGGEMGRRGERTWAPVASVDGYAACLRVSALSDRPG